MKKGILKAVGFMVLIGVIYLFANMIVALLLVGFILIQNPALISGNPEYLVNTILLEINNYLLHMVIAANFLSLLIISLVFLARKDKLIQYCKFRKVKPIDGFVMVGFGAFMNILFITILSLIGNLEMFSNQLDKYSELMAPMMDSPFIIMFIAIAIAAPIFEEIIMRGIILNDFRKVTPLWLAIVIQAAAFGFMHFNIVQSSYAAVLGLVLGLIYIKYNSIWMPILFHFSFNLTSLLSDLIIGENMSLFALGLIGVIGSIVFLFVARLNYDSDFYKESIETLNLSIEDQRNEDQRNEEVINREFH